MNKLWNKIKGWFKPKSAKKPKPKEFTIEERLKRCEKLIEQLEQLNKEIEKEKNHGKN